MDEWHVSGSITYTGYRYMIDSVVKYHEPVVLELGSLDNYSYLARSLFSTIEIHTNLQFVPFVLNHELTKKKYIF